MQNPEQQTPQEVPYPHVSKWKRYRFVFIGLLFTFLLRFFSWLFSLLKWLSMPLAFVFDLFVLFPVGKFMVRINTQPAYREVSESELPDTVWQHFMISQRRFGQLGFTVGRYLCTGDMIPNQIFYHMTIVNKTAHMAASVVYIQVPKAKDGSMDTMACEFTCVKDGVFLDVTNNSIIEPFLPMPGRLRLVMEFFTDAQLYHLMTLLQQKLACQCNDKMLEFLATNPRLIFSDEMKMMMGVNVKRGLLYLDKQKQILRLTWKGAFISAMQTLWPTSILYRKHLAKMSADVFARLQLDPETAVREIEEARQERSLHSEIKSIADVIRFAIAQADMVCRVADLISVSIYVSNTNGLMTVSQVMAVFGNEVEHAERNMRERLSCSLQLDLEAQRAYVLDDEHGIYTQDEYAAYAFEPVQHLPENIGESLDFMQIIQAFRAAAQLTDAMEGEEEYVCQMQNGKPVWTYMDYDEEGEAAIMLDPFSGI